VIVPVVNVRHMRVAVTHGLVPVGMAVGALGHGIVMMVVVAVVVAVGVFMRQRLVFMFMVVRLGQVHGHA
jgi:hypothetical protein